MLRVSMCDRYLYCWIHINKPRKQGMSGFQERLVSIEKVPDVSELHLHEVLQEDLVNLEEEP